mgnify:CR=1 FL=1
MANMEREKRSGVLELKLRKHEVDGEEVERIDTDFWSEKLNKRVYVAWDGKHNNKETAVYVHIVGESQIKLQQRLGSWEMWVDNYKNPQKDFYRFSRSGSLCNKKVDLGDNLRMKNCYLLENNWWNLGIAFEGEVESLFLPREIE